VGCTVNGQSRRARFKPALKMLGVLHVDLAYQTVNFMLEFIGSVNAQQVPRLYQTFTEFLDHQRGQRRRFRATCHVLRAVSRVSLNFFDQNPNVVGHSTPAFYSVDLAKTVPSSDRLVLLIFLGNGRVERTLPAVKVL
jgi:hypothetical protein